MKYLKKFNESTKDDMWQYQVIVKADTNDADYITNITKWDEDEYMANMPMLRKVCNAIKKNRGSWPNGEMSGGRRGTTSTLYLETGLLTAEEIEFFDEITPYGEHGIHTIESVKVVEIVSEEELLK